MKISLYKRLLIVIGIFTLLYTLSSCNATKRFDKAAKRYGAKESVKRLIETNPEYFNFNTFNDTIRITDTMFVAERDGTIVGDVIHDTIYFKDTNVDIKINKETGKGNYKILKDTVFINKEIPVQIKVPCPAQSILKEQNDKLTIDNAVNKSNKNKWKILFFSLLSLNLIYIIIKLYAKFAKPI
jgi:uncharacterized protein YpmS